MATPPTFNQAGVPSGNELRSASSAQTEALKAIKNKEQEQSVQSSRMKVEYDKFEKFRQAIG
ncbi:MAG: hypothetical protein HOA17_10075 [Candidatus Melainabacteria bacterium]|jgi:hypothetical protein|nr:hypothetical protein [Candidatus Melainabacteria bacterium]